MDVTSWGQHEHQLHARIAPARAAEYHLPIFRLCSSGISELALPNATLAASAPYPGQSQTLAAYLPMNTHPTLPPDRNLAPLCTALTLLFLLILPFIHLLQPRTSPK